MTLTEWRKGWEVLKRLCNQTTNTDIPVCLAYDQAHYETLVPDTEEEILKTIALKNDILNGTYSVQMNDIPFLVKPPKHKSYAQIVKSPSQKSENSKRLRENEYKGPIQQNRRNTKDMKLNDSEIKNPKLQEAERKRNFRQNRSEEQIELEKMKQKIVSVFAEYGLGITISINLKTVNFLDVTFDLGTIYDHLNSKLAQFWQSFDTFDSLRTGPQKIFF